MSRNRWAAAGAVVCGLAAATAGAGRWVSATPPPAPAAAGEPAAPARRTEAVVRLPQGTFAKTVDVPGYGSGRVVWAYDGDRVGGRIEVEAMGGELELATEAEVSLSRAGTVYGVVTGVRLERLKLPPGLAGEDKGLGALYQIGLWPAVEPLVNEVCTDLPFSYRARLAGDRLVISSYRILLAGPNPLGKLGGLTAGGDGAFAALAYFQALGTAFEGSYEPAGDEPPAPERKPARKSVKVARAGG